MHIIYIGLAGALGATCRYILSLSLPFPTMVVNITGAFILGFLTVYFTHRSRIASSIKTAITTGFLGSFTTFSAFSNEAIQLWQNSSTGVAITYVCITVFLGLLSAYVGTMLARKCVCV